ncbi:MAG: hypothetical protein RLZZ96_781 [Bacteroidota bacterium]|jgi:hypothetical protein
MRIYLFFLLVFLSSCAKSVLPVQIADKSVYVDRFPAIKPGLTTMDFSLSYDSLLVLSQLKAGSLLYQNASASSAIDFPLDVRLLAPIQFKALQKDQLSLSLPVRMSAKPELAGISAGLVTGDLAMQVQLKLNLANLISLQVKEVSYGYEWIQKPSVKVMGFPVNVSGLVDQLLNQKKALILAQMQEQLNASIRNTVSKPFSLQSFISESPTGYRFEPVPTSALDLRNLTFEQTEIKGQLRYFGGFKVVSGQNNGKPIFIPIKDLPGVATPTLPFQFQMTGPELIDQIKSFNTSLKGAGSFVFQKEGLGFQLVQFKGKSSKLEVDFDFVIYPDNSVGIQLKDTRLQGLSFPASLFKNNIQRKLQAQASAFRFKPSLILSRLPSSITLAKNGRVRFQKIYFDSSSVLIEGVFEGNWSLAK